MLSETASTSVPGDEFDALMAPETNASIALGWARQGFPVFPIIDWGDGGDWKPVKGWPDKASTDAAQVAAWWERCPEARVGLLTGERSGITVLDIDAKNGKDGLASLAKLGFPDVTSLSPVRVRTPSGGWHVFFRHDTRLKNWVSKLGSGLDVRNDRGYVGAPGSYKNGVRYRPDGAPLGSIELPAIPEALIPAAEPERDPVAPLTEATLEQVAWAADRLRTRAGELAGLREGEGRNDELNRLAMWAGGAAAHGFLSHDAAEEILWAAAEAAGLKKREFRATFKSGWNAGLKRPISDFPRETAADEFDELPEQAASSASHLRFLTPGQCADAPARGYVIKGFLAPGDVACIFGAPGAGKSLISPHLGYAVAQGGSAFGMRTKSGQVFYVAAEDPHGMRGRVSALKRRHGDAAGFTLVEGVSDLLTRDSLDLRALFAAVKEQSPSLIFIDTLAMSFPGLEENSADAMGRVVAIARKLASHGAAVVLIHHDTKAGTPTPRGHSLLNGALDVALQLFPRDEAGVVRGKLTKNRNGSCDRDIAFKIATEAMGVDEDGDAIAYALVDELASGGGAARLKLTAGERAAYRILGDMLYLCGDTSVAETDWRAKCIDARTVSASDDVESRKRATRRAFEGLARKRAVSIRGGLVSAPPT
jgi:archaellum biogenesis ATPase FlaH